MKPILGLVLGSLCLPSLTACSTAPSPPPPPPLVVRSVTASCPAPQVEIDRSFAVEPPQCLSAIGPYDPEDGSVWAGLVIDGVGAVEVRDICLDEVRDWIQSERDAEGASQ